MKSIVSVAITGLSVSVLNVAGSGCTAQSEPPEPAAGGASLENTQEDPTNTNGGGGTSGANGGRGSFGGGGGKVGVFFSSDLEQGELNDIFLEANKLNGITCELSKEYAHSGSRSIKLGYPNDEAGVALKPYPFSHYGLPQGTETLFVRKYELFTPGWEGNWPIGLKTSRYFTRSDWTTGGDDNKSAYLSEKLIWQTYDTTCNEQVALGMNNACINCDIVDQYQPNELFSNGLPYIRTGHWYKFETWLRMDSAIDTNDGVLKVWIDDVLVFASDHVPFRTAGGKPAAPHPCSAAQNRPAVLYPRPDHPTEDGVGWQSMWFGGNYSGDKEICGGPDQTVYRYLDDLYLSTTCDRADC